MVVALPLDLLTVVARMMATEAEEEEAQIEEEVAVVAAEVVAIGIVSIAVNLAIFQGTARKKESK